MTAGPPTLRHVPLTEEAIAAVLADATFPSGFVLALVPEAEAAQVPVLQAACRSRGIPLVGAVFPRLVVADGFSSEGVWLAGLPFARPHRLVALGGCDPGAAAERIGAFVTSALEEGGDEAPTLFLVFDAMVPSVASILDGLYLRLGDQVTYSGVNAGSETFRPTPCVFDAERFVGDAALVVLLDPQGHPPVAEHGYERAARTMSATATEGNCIHTIDWRPAFDAYRELVWADYGIALTRENFYRYSVHFPFGIVRACDEMVVRIPVALTDDGSLFCVGEVPPNALLVLLKGPTVDSAACVAHLAERLEASTGDLAARDVLTFYCAGRRLHLGDDAAIEVGRLTAALGARSIAGALSLGEIGSADGFGYPMFHNAALVCAVWDPG